MPGFPWLEENVLDGKHTQRKLEIFKNNFGVPYTDEQVANAQKEVAGKTEMDALIAYLQSLGHAMK
ncbi:cytochrome c oxidase subunit ccoO [Vibrio ishigakensis]|nr:cytochrome c oxidase subunit ccoO [Vibrio ishigakensis]